MTLSTGPWWCAPVFALGWITTVPAQSFSAPARACVIAAARFMPGVWGVLMSSSLECTTRTPSCFHFAWGPLGIRWFFRRRGVVRSGKCQCLGRIIAADAEDAQPRAVRNAIGDVMRFAKTVLAAAAMALA